MNKRNLSKIIKELYLSLPESQRGVFLERVSKELQPPTTPAAVNLQEDADEDEDIQLSKLKASMNPKSKETPEQIEKRMASKARAREYIQNILAKASRDKFSDKLRQSEIDRLSSKEVTPPNDYTIEEYSTKENDPANVEVLPPTSKIPKSYKDWIKSKSVDIVPSKPDEPEIPRRFDEGEEEDKVDDRGIWSAKWLKGEPTDLPKKPESDVKEKGKGLISWPVDPSVNEAEGGDDLDADFHADWGKEWGGMKTFNMKKDYPQHGLVRGSTVSQQTLDKHGLKYKLPEPPKIDEMSTTGGVAGYQTAKAFGARGQWKPAGTKNDPKKQDSSYWKDHKRVDPRNKFGKTRDQLGDEERKTGQLEENSFEAAGGGMGAMNYQTSLATANPQGAVGFGSSVSPNTETAPATVTGSMWKQKPIGFEEEPSLSETYKKNVTGEVDTDTLGRYGATILGKIAYNQQPWSKKPASGNLSGYKQV